MLYWLCDLGHTMDDAELHLLECYVSMQSLPPYCGVFVYNLWLLDNRNYQVSEASVSILLYLLLIIGLSHISEVGEVFVADS